MSKDSKKWEEELKEKLNKELSEGIYDISVGNLVCFTGKQGKIDLEVEIIKELNQNKEDVSVRKIVRCEDPMVCLRGCSVHEQTCKHPIYGC